MQFPSFLFTILLTFTLNHASAMPQGVFETISPPDGPPPGCVTTYSPLFSLHVLDSSYSGAPGFIGRSCMQDGILMVRLADGVLIDGLGRIGSIVANRQFQFDGPPAQAGAIYTGGFAVCDDGTMSLGGSNQFFQCSSGDFSNIYDQAIADYCEPILLGVNQLQTC